MKKTSRTSDRKLAVRRETLRQLDGLGSRDLALVAGGIRDPTVGDTYGKTSGVCLG